MDPGIVWSILGGGAFVGAMAMKAVDYGIEKKDV